MLWVPETFLPSVSIMWTPVDRTLSLVIELMSLAGPEA
jgi:hypothetical protein